MYLRLFLISVASLLSLLIFQSGFLLKRNELHFNSTCADVKLQPGGCWLPKQYSKIVVLLVDALRYDFLLPHDGPASNFRGQMAGVAKLLQEGAAVVTVLADPPTTTLQRIKGLTTGTLPTFIDSADNFSPDATVQEDNFIHQALKQNRTIRFFGDDTWFSLYPELSAPGSHGYPSFDVNDLDTVDDAVRTHLQSHFAAGEEADLVIGHTLGVDHCGHKFGPSHPQMATILKRTDQLIFKTASSLKEGELLIVLGDHGMTSTGDHGGDSDDETHAGLFLYTPGRQISLSSERSYSQIDLVPTLSLLLGVPIPFSNLGVVIPDLFPGNLRSLAIELNYNQQMRFATTYASQNGMTELLEVTSRDATTPEDQLWSMGRIQETLRRVWTRFDWPRMRTGLVSMLETSLFMFSGRTMDWPEAIVRTGCLLLQGSVLGSDNSDNSLAFPLLMVVLPLSIVYSVGCLFLQAALNLQNISPVKLAAVAAVLLHGVSFTSNSYVVYGAQTVRYLLQGIVLVASYESFRRLSKVTRKQQPKGTGLSLMGYVNTNQGVNTAISLLLLRLEPIFHRCREEEVSCETSFLVQMLGAVSADARFFRVVISWSLLLLFYVLLYRRDQPHSLISSLSRLAIIFTIGHHLCQLVIVSSYVVVPNLPIAAMVLAQGVYFCSAVAVLLVVFYRNELSAYDNGKYVAYAVNWTLLLLLGDGMVPALLGYVMLVISLTYLVDEYSLPWLSSLLISFGFYLTGHSPTIPAIPWTAGFIGLPGNFFLKAAPGILIGSHLFCANILTVLLLPLHQSFSRTETLSSLMATGSIRALFVSLAALLHRRHLMVWKIFAPHFIFEAVSFLVLTVLVLARQATLPKNRAD